MHFYVIKVSMEPLVKQMKRYLGAVTTSAVSVRQLKLGALPAFLNPLYSFRQLTIGTVPFTAVLLKHAEEFTPAKFLKHMSQVPKIDPHEICVVASSLPPYVRKRLVEKKVAFIVPDTQMHLPRLGVELQARGWKRNPANVEQLSPVSQVVLFYGLLGHVDEPITPLQLSKELSYSAMSMTRALNELEHCELAHTQRVGHERCLSFSKKKATIWKEALPRLRNPVRKTLRISENKLDQQYAFLAGTTALAAQSMLAEPVCPEFAISQPAWKSMKESGAEVIPIEEDGTCLLQVWAYDPGLLAMDTYVDPFSLYLSLEQEADERIAKALETMLRRYL